jgi:hypothetical protein
MTDDGLTPAEWPELDSAWEALWEARHADLNAYRARVRSLAADRSLPRLAVVWCNSCGPDDGRRRPPGVIVDSPDGPLLVTWHTRPAVIGGRAVSPSERKALGYGHPRLSPQGCLVDGPNTHAARFAEWHAPDPEEDIPRIRCAQHGVLTLDPDELRAAIRSGWPALRVATGGHVSRA